MLAGNAAAIITAMKVGAAEVNYKSPLSQPTKVGDEFENVTWTLECGPGSEDSAGGNAAVAYLGAATFNFATWFESTKAECGRSAFS
jgi:hypothetical protein